MQLDQDVCYRAVKGRDRRFDGVFYTAVRTTGIYCRPSCPATTPHRRNVSFFQTAAGAQGAGYRACRRCLPDATPGSPEWDVAADVAARAMRLVSDGVVEREGVDGLARALGYSTRQLNRVVTREYGAGPLALARSRRAQTARVLIETTDLTFTDIAFAAGFASVRQFNDTLREVYAASPTQLRSKAGSRRRLGTSGTIHTRIAVREPFAAADLHRFLALHAVRGDRGLRPRLVRAGGPPPARARRGPRRAAGAPGRTGPVHLHAHRRARPRARDGAHPPSPRRRRGPGRGRRGAGRGRAAGAAGGRRRPGCGSRATSTAHEVALQTVLGQQVSLAAARTAAGRLVAEHGDRLDLTGPHAVTHLFPSTATVAGLDPATLRMPRSRGRALVGLAAALADGEVRLDRSSDRQEVRAGLLALPGIGPWTADYVAMRALGDPDVFLPTDIGVRNAATRLGIHDLAERTAAWRPWRSYALLRLWSVVLDEMSVPESSGSTAADPETDPGTTGGAASSDNRTET